MRCWYTPDGEILVEGDPVAPVVVSDFAICDEDDRPLASAHRYRLFDAWGALREVFEPHSGSVDDELWGWTHEVVDGALVRFLTSHLTSPTRYRRWSRRSVERAGLLPLDPTLVPGVPATVDTGLDEDGATAELDAALGRLRAAFAGYPVRDVLPGCPCCKGDVRWAEHDLVSLSISLGNVVGTFDDLKSLLPVLLARLVDHDVGAAERPDETVVLGKLVTERHWRTWPDAERDAVEGYLRAVWRALLSTYPARTGAFLDAATFLYAVGPVYGDLSWFLRTWRAVNPPAADRHLANLVLAWVSTGRLPDEVVRWLAEPTTRGLVYLAFVRATGPWADDLARAYDYLAVG
jgi:hypothetical protein